MRPWRLCSTVALLAAAAPAQTAGGISGKVVEAGSGGPVAGAVVIATGDALQGERAASTDASGEFDLPALPPGSYILDVQARGHQSFTQAGVMVALDREVRLRLEIFAAGASGAAVGGLAQRPAISGPSISSGGTVSRDQAELIPYGRERMTFEQPAAAVPGVLLDPRFLIDGLDVTAPSGLLGTRLLQRFVDQISVLRGVYSAEFGRSTGALLHAVTRSGGNEFHGSLFASALPWEASRQQPGAAVGFAGQGGFELGGPIQRDRLWFYGGVAPETVSSGGGSETDLQYVGKLTFRPGEDHALALSAFGDPGAGAGSNDLALRYQGNLDGVLLEGSAGWLHQRADGDRLEGALSAGKWVQGLGHHRLKAGADLARESAGGAFQTLFAAYAQDAWAVQDTVLLDVGVRFEAQHRASSDVSEILPRAGLSYDFTGRGLSRIYLAAGRFFTPAPPSTQSGRVANAVSSGVEYQIYRDLVGSADFTHQENFDGLTLALGKPLSENYLVQASYTFSGAPNFFKLDAAYLYEWSAKTTTSLGAAIRVSSGVAEVDARAALRQLLTATYQLALNLDLLNALNHQSDAAEPPLAIRFGAALSF